MPNDLLNSTICLESLICVAQVPMMEQIMRSPLFLVPGEVIQFWANGLSKREETSEAGGGRAEVIVSLF